MANNASATVDLKILISVIQNQSQNISSINQQLQTMLRQLQTTVPQGVLGTLSNQVAGLNANVNRMQGSSAQGNAALKSLDATAQSLVRTFKLLTGGFLAFQSVRFLKDLADTAARAEVLQTVLRVVAKNAGVTAAEIDKVDQQVQRLGITSAASRESLTKLLQARLPIELGPKLARASQDLAVIADRDSSQTFARLIVNIQQLDTLGLRHMGIIVSRTEAEQKYKVAIGATNRELTQREKVAGFAAEVVLEATKLEGTYTSAMDNVAKQMASLTRLTLTYKEVLGTQLLPAFSVIVQTIGSTIEKLTILGKQWAGNREQAQSLADAIRPVVWFLSEATVFVMKHLDSIIRLITWYAELKVFLWFFRGAEAYFLWLIKVIDWFTKLRIVLTALRDGLIGFRTAMAIMGAQSAASAQQLVLLSVAQGQVAATAVPAAAGIKLVGDQALITTTAVRGLGLAWVLMAASLAIPVVGYLLYDIKQKADKAKEKTTLQKALEARPWFGEPIAEGVSTTQLDVWFDLWKSENPKLVADLKTNTALMAEFNKQLDQTAVRAKMDQLVDSLAEAKRELTAAQVARDQAINPPPGQIKAELGEQDILDKRVSEKAQRVNQLREFIRETFKYIPLLKETDDVLKEIDKRDAAREAAAKARKDPLRTDKTVADADALLEIEEEKVKAMTEQAELAISRDQNLSQSAKDMERAAVNLKAESTATKDAAQAITEARGKLLGEFTFGPKGVTTAAFGASLDNYTKMLEGAEGTLARKKALDQDVIDSLKKGLVPLGAGAKLPLDLAGFEAIASRIKSMEGAVPGISKILAEQLATARIGVDEERFKSTAELTAKRKTQAKQYYDAVIQAAQEEFETIKDIEAKKSEQRDVDFRDGVVKLTEYYNLRRNRIQVEGAAELDLLEKQAAAARTQADIGNQTPEARALNAIAVAKADAAIKNLNEQISLQLRIEDIAERERREALRDEALGGTLGLRAAQGGTAEALAQMEFQQYQDRKKFAALGDTINQADASRFLILKDITQLAEIYRKEREKAYQIEVDIEQAVRDQLDVLQKARDIEAAKDKAAVARGGMSDATAMRRENLRLQEAMADNREALASAERKAQAARDRRFDDLLAKEHELIGIGVIDPDERARQMAPLQAELTKEVATTEAAVQDLQLAYVNLAATVQSYNQQLRTSFTNSFANAMTQSIVNFKQAGQAWISMAQQFSSEIVGIFTQALAKRLFRNLSFAWVDRLLGTGGVLTQPLLPGLATGGLIDGPGTGTSDSVPAMLSAGEHVMPAAKTATWLPVLEAIRTGRLTMMGGGGLVQSVAFGPIIPRHYAGGGVVMTDAGAAAVTPGGMGGNMQISLHPEALNMTMRDWLEHEVVRQHSRR